MTRKEESRRVRSTTKVILKIFLTLLVGGTAFFITHLSSESLIWELTMSVLTGGIALLVQFLNDFENRLEKVEQKQEDHAE